MKNLYTLLCCLSLMFSTTVSSQVLSPLGQAEINMVPALDDPHNGHYGCATPPLTKVQREAMREKIREAGITRSDGITYVPVKAHFLRPSNGDSSWEPTPEELAVMIAYSSNRLYGAGMMFYLCGEVEYVNSSQYHDFEFEGAEDVDDLLNNTNPSNGALNMYFAGSVLYFGEEAGGFAYFPGGNTLRESVSLISMEYGTGWATYPTIPHELGHHFALPHTFDFTSEGPNEAGAENVARTGPNANCENSGDGFCDTPADPLGTTSNCVFNAGDVDAFGDLYAPMVSNVMSYYGFCVSEFTPDQEAEMVLARDYRASGSTVNLSCTGDIVNMPTDLNVDVIGNGYVLNWTDIASNELGYLIERADASSPGAFVTLGEGGVAANVESYIDDTAISGQDYIYRIRPLNGSPTTNGYSNSACTNGANCPTLVTCDDGIQNGDETGIDCGGTSCPDCEPVCPTNATTLTVTNLNDSGPGSFRAAIECANGSTIVENINFDLPFSPPYVINVGPTSLPTVVKPNLTISGYTPNFQVVNLDGAGVSGNGNGLVLDGDNIRVETMTITGFPGAGVVIGTSQNTGVNGLFVSECNDGIRVSGFENYVHNSSVWQNDRHGIVVETGNTILIEEVTAGFNGQDGIFIQDNTSADQLTNVEITGCSIGGDIEGDFWPNERNGIHVGRFARDIRIGRIQDGFFNIFDATNFISNNETGILYGTSTSGIEVYQNSMSCNETGINRSSNSSNEGVPAPVIISASPTMISGTGTAGHRIVVYQKNAENINGSCPDSDCQGAFLLEETPVDANGNWSVFTPFPLSFGAEVTALATNLNQSTSLFSGCAVVTTSTCDDGVQNGLETGVDCGGPDCPVCPDPCDDLVVSAELNFSPSTICPGDETNITVTVSSNGVFPLSAQITGPGASPQVISIPGPGAQTFTVTPPEAGTYTISGFEDAEACTVSTSASGTINFRPLVSTPQLSCGGTTESSATLLYELDPAVQQYQVTINGGSIITTSGGTFTAQNLPADTDVTFVFTGVGQCNGATSMITCRTDPALPTCDDGIQNGQETGVDCGGPDCADCPVDCQNSSYDYSITASESSVCAGGAVTFSLVLSADAAGTVFTLSISDPVGGDFTLVHPGDGSSLDFTRTVPLGTTTWSITGVSDDLGCGDNTLRSVSVTGGLAPEPPVVSCGQATMNSVIINYELQNGVTDYAIIINDGPLTPTSGGSYLVEGLSPGEVVFGAVVVNNDAGCGDSFTEFECVALAGPCADATFDYSITAEDQAVCAGDEVTFGVMLTASPNPPFLVTISAPGETPFTLSHPGDGSVVTFTRIVNTTITYAITLVTDAEECADAQGAETTVTAVPTPANPDFSCSTVNETSLQVVWTEDPNALGYEINVDGGGFQPVTGGVFNANGLSGGQTVDFVLRVLSDLCPAGQYTISCTTEDSDPCLTSTFEYGITASDEAPCPGDLVTFSLFLDATGNPPFTLFVSEPGQPVFTVNHPGDGTAVTFSRIINGAGIYRILEATDGDGCGVSVETSVLVNPNEPIFIPDFACGTATNSSLSVQWSVDPRVSDYQMIVNGGAPQPVSGGFFTVNGLTPGETVDFILIANPNEEGCVVAQAQLSCTTIEDPCFGSEVEAFSTTARYCSTTGFFNLNLYNFEVAGGNNSVTVSWFRDPDGVQPIANPAFFAPATPPNTVYARTVLDGCESDIVPVTLEVEIGVTPVFSGIPEQICLDGQIFFLPQPNNGITGNWFVSGLGQTSSIPTDGSLGDIIDAFFTPDEEFCADGITITLTTTPLVEPVFAQDFVEICVDQELLQLPATDLNGVAGSWSIREDGTLPVPNELDISGSGGQTLTYYFHPFEGCSNSTSVTFLIGEYIELDFMVSADTVCLDSLIAFTYLGADAGAGEVVWSSEPPADIIAGDAFEASFGWNTPGEKQITLTQTFGGCVSIFSRTVVVEECIFCDDYFAPAEDLVTCANQPVEWRGASYGEEGSYFDTVRTENFCDSIYQLNLSFEPGVVFTSCPGDIEEVYNPETGADLSWEIPTAESACGPDFDFSDFTSLTGQRNDTLITYVAAANDGSMASCSFNISLTPTDSMTFYVVSDGVHMISEDTMMVPLAVRNFRQGEGFQLQLTLEDLDATGAFTGDVVAVNAVIANGLLAANAVTTNRMNLVWVDIDNPVALDFPDGTILLEIEVAISGAPGACLGMDFATDLPEVSTAVQSGEEIYPTTIGGNVCLPAFGDIDGTVFRFDADNVRQPMPGVPVTLTTENAEPRASTTGADGTYSFTDILVGERYTVTPTLDEDHLNGISIADVLMIRNLALGTVNGSSPTTAYQYLAANVVPDDCSINIVDLVEEIRLLSGAIPEFTSVPSYRFVSTDQTFPSVEDIRSGTDGEYCGITEHLIVDFTDPDTTLTDLIALKMGDVNRSGGDPAPNGDGFVGLPDLAFRAGEWVEVTPTLPDGVVAADLTWRFNADLVTVDKQTGLRLLRESWSLTGNDLHHVWTDQTGATTLRFRARRAGKISDVLTLAPGSVGATERGDLLNLQVRSGAVLPSGEVSVRVAPNPFRDRLDLTIEAASGGDLFLSVVDVNGKIVVRRTVTAGNVSLPSADWPTGVYYLRIAGPEGEEYRKVVKQ